ncbi:hypothetical protein [Glutamicibacter ardleyensis]|uniref:Uncharacterized protein n=1 Tax=Glutamicibacter ardleyensis TaxID=225894 RepID=A0ABQ2DK40_9MICC|nr:hypothetical protein [Glutamicibacter ardleyensis]GGJ58961.1 hypothetical protein GCM10007173_17120 [Glutamicibacter ardleyensis]
MATIDYEAQRQLEYAVACLNGLNPRTTLRGSLHIDYEANVITAEEIIVDNFAMLFGNGKPEIKTRIVTREIIALPHQLRGMRK